MWLAKRLSAGLERVMNRTQADATLGGFLRRASYAAMMVLVIVGGLAYTAGAVVYGLKKPNPVPGVFGFHEIFHTLTVVAFLCHWTGVLLVALDPPFGG